MTQIKLQLSIDKIDEKIAEFEQLEEAHINHKKCLEPDHCETVSMLRWIVFQLKDIQHQKEKAEEQVWEYKRTPYFNEDE